MNHNDLSFDEMREGLIRSLGLEFNRVCATLDTSHSRQVEAWSKRLDQSHMRDWKGIAAGGVVAGLSMAALPDMATAFLWGSTCALAMGLHLADQVRERKDIAGEIMTIVSDKEYRTRQMHVRPPRSWPFGNN